MAKVEIIKPSIITLEFHQEKQDKDYGTCMWATFLIDKENYRLNIYSECGSYGCSWIQTHKSESFLHLLSRIDKDYLLNKLGYPTDVDVEDTYNDIKTYLESLGEEENTSLVELGIEEKELYNACKHLNSSSVFSSIISLMKSSKLHNKIDCYEITINISKTYPKPLKKIVKIFVTHIQPFIKENLL